MTKNPVWRCPVCGREFAKLRQAHSCRPVSVDAHFKGKAVWLRELFDDLCRQLTKFGALRIDAVKTGINLIPKHHMGSVKVLKDRLHVGFLISRPLRGRRIARSHQIGPNAHLHTVNLSSRRELDAELLSWLKEAYERAAGTEKDQP